MQECHVQTIRDIEKTYHPKPHSAREKLRADIDRFVPLSKDIFYLMAYLVKEGYDIKHGKYLAFRPKDSKNFVRLKSLGAEYSEIALKGRIRANQEFEKQIDEQYAAAKENQQKNRPVLRMIQLYIGVVKDGRLTPRKRIPEKVYSWSNDAELDRLLALNKRINDGATLQSLRQDFTAKDEAMHQKYDAAQREKNDLCFALDLKEKLELLFGGIPSERFTRQQAEDILRKYPSITAGNWRSVETMISNCREQAAKAAEELAQAEAELKNAAELYTLAERVYAGVYVQELVNSEREAREAAEYPSGTIAADNQVPDYIPLKR